MRKSGKVIAAAILLLALAAGVFLYQRDRTARYPFGFTRDEIVSAVISTPAERLTLRGPEEIDTLWKALTRMRIKGETETAGGERNLKLGGARYTLEIELTDDRSRTFQVNSDVFSSSGHPAYTVRNLDLTELWWSITGAYPEAVC